MSNLSGATTAVFIVSLSAALEVPVNVAWQTKDGTAKAGTDYEAATGSVTFEAGETQKQIQVTVYGREAGDTAARKFSILLYPPENAILDQTLTDVEIQVTDSEGVAVTSLVVATGPRGIKGDPGLSAYELAKIQGYTGTLQEWLESQNPAAAMLQKTLRVSESDIPMLPDASIRKNKILAFSDTGNPIAVLPESGSAADVMIELASHELPGASLVSLVYGNVAGLLQGMTYPQAHGARGDGIHDDTDALYAAFKSSAETVRIPRGTYLITRKLKCLLAKNLNVVCAPGAVFKLADGVRDKMFVFVGADNRKYDFSWFGGEIDGNWRGQGEETLNSNGTFKDLSRGMVASLFNRVRLENIYVHDFRGHSINHAGNRELYARGLRFNSHVAQAFPLGGSRGDGITGCSEIVDINGVYGFTTDDMVAVFAGILWVEGGTESDSEMVTDLRYLTSKSINIENVGAGKKLSDLDGTTEVYTWNAVAISTQGGIPADKITIKNITGYCQYSAIRNGASQPVGSSPATDYWGDISSINIDGVSVRVAGTSDNQHLYNIIRLGSLTAATSGTEYQCIIKSVTISNVQIYPSGNTRTLIGVGYTTIYNLNVNNITVLGQVTDDTYNLLRCVGNRQIAQISINGITHNPPTTTSDTVAQAQLMLSWEVTFPVPAKITVNGLPVRRNAADTAYISNVNIVAGAVAPQIYGYDAVVRTPTNFYALPKVKGIYCRDRYLGKVRVAPSGLWELEEFATKYEDSTYGRPSPTLMPGYSNITWEDGMTVKTYGSPYGEVQGWRYNRDGNWQMLGGYLTNNAVAMIDVSTVPSKFAPYTTITSPIYNDASWPISNGAVTLYTGHPNGRAGAYEKIDGGTVIYRRTWNAAASGWNPWFSTSLT